MLTRRNTIGSLRFPDHLCSGEDLWYVLRLFIEAGSIVKVDEPLYIYNQENNESITHKMDGRAEQSILQGIMENREYLRENGLFESVRREFYWSVLRFKSRYALDPQRTASYRTILPEANRYLPSCPLLSFRVKAVMALLALHLDGIARHILHAYRS